MLAIKDTIRKFSVLDDDDATIVINLVDFLSKNKKAGTKPEKEIIIHLEESEKTGSNS